MHRQLHCSEQRPLIGARFVVALLHSNRNVRRSSHSLCSSDSICSSATAPFNLVRQLCGSSDAAHRLQLLQRISVCRSQHRIRLLRGGGGRGG